MSKDEISRVPPHWWWRELTQQVQMSPPLLLSESWEQTWLETTAERFPNTLPLPPALDLEKLCIGRGDSVSLTRSTWSLTSGCKSICKHKVPVGLPKSFDYSVFGQAAYRQLIRVVGISWSALLLGCSSLVPRQCWQLLPVQTLALGLAWRWASSQTLCRHIFPSFSSWLFSCQENQKRPARVIVLVRRTCSHLDPNWKRQLFPRWERFDDKMP